MCLIGPNKCVKLRRQPSKNDRFEARISSFDWRTSHVLMFGQGPRSAVGEMSEGGRDERKECRNREFTKSIGAFLSIKWCTSLIDHPIVCAVRRSIALPHTKTHRERTVTKNAKQRSAGMMPRATSAEPNGKRNRGSHCFLSAILEQDTFGYRRTEMEFERFRWWRRWAHSCLTDCFYCTRGLHALEQQ